MEPLQLALMWSKSISRPHNGWQQACPIFSIRRIPEVPKSPKLKLLEPAVLSFPKPEVCSFPKPEVCSLDRPEVRLSLDSASGSGFASFFFSELHFSPTCFTGYQGNLICLSWKFALMRLYWVAAQLSTNELEIFSTIPYPHKLASLSFFNEEDVLQFYYSFFSICPSLFVFKFLRKMETNLIFFRLSCSVWYL